MPRVLKETEQARAARTAYHELGPGRTIAALAAATGVASSVLGRWRSAFHWEESATSYDIAVAAHDARAATDDEVEAKLKLREERRTDRLLTAQIARLKAYDYFNGREIEGEYTEDGRTLRKGMSPAQAQVALNLWKYANDTERLDLDEPTERIALQGLESSSTTISIEMIQTQLKAVVQQAQTWRAEQGLVPIDHPDPLSAYSATLAPPTE